MVKIGSFLRQCVRVFKLSRKPTTQEVKQVSKVSALGILGIGLMGFVIGVILKFIL